MNNGIANRILILMLLFVAPVLAAACNSGSGGQTTQADKPVANITSPASNSNFSVGQDVLITFTAADVKGVNQVELVVDGEAVLVEPVSPPVNSYTASYRWQPQAGGSHVIELRAFNVDNVASDPAQIFVLVSPAASQIDPTATPILAPDTPTPTPAAVTPLFPPLPTDTPTPQIDLAASQPLVTALVRLNVRLGPSTDYPVVGQLAINQTARITGRDELSAWWQIEFQSDRGDRGWVAAGSEFSTAASAQGVAVAQAPPLEQVAAPTPTSPPPSPTPAPQNLKPTIFSFTADRYEIKAGESVTLSWDLANAQAAYLRFDGNEEGVAAPGSKTVSPQKETKYTLVARNEAGETIAEVTIKISSPGPTPPPVLRDGKVRIANNQFLDFDQGLVQPDSNTDTDFQWSGQARQFLALNGATGTLINKSYSDITFQDCQTAAYDKPISGVDGSSPVRGCYKTSQGRFGRFVISEWDVALNLTIEWQTWNYP